jgi:predicted nucleic acid-binding Zn ribbon protein
VSLQTLAEQISPATPLAQIQSVWEQAAGSTISASAQPIKEREGVLTLACSGSAWAQEINLMADEVIKRLNEALGSDVVHELRCRTA